ncbi:MAG TPA: bifunctional phosphoglucose/phosphomannose isomerase [Candidatus Saccharimonadales bacterium]|nr:bifunctional phosphoglucose/phosphomannose isomerase [Candidatus Saccharimonadales bacterium]
MLDDLKQLHQADPEDALGVAEKQWTQLGHTYDLAGWQPKTSLQNIVHSGMGGSALWALLSTSWPGWKLPFTVTRTYDIPAYVGPETLFIASSYSGNTEETLSSLDQAEQKGAQIVIITSGGKLADIAREKNYLLIELPKIDKPRYGALYGLKGLITLGEHLGLLAEPNAVKALEDCSDFLHESIENWVVTVPTDKNQAKQLALETIGKSPVIYGGDLLSTAAHKWKISFNENSKNVAWEYAFPEFNHNEFTGWTSHPVDKPYTVFYLQSSYDNDRIKKRFDLSAKLLSGRWPEPERVEAQGETKLEQLLWTVALGDFISLYTAFANGVSPIDVGDKDIIERFKKELNS